MALVLRCGIDDELIDRTLHARVGILVQVGHGGCEPDEPLAVGCHKNPKRGLWRSLDGGAP
jgi:hypothetical protein